MVEIDLDSLAVAYRHRPLTVAGEARAGAAADAAGLGAGSVALDVGGGWGDHAAVFAGRGSMAVVLDRSPAMVGGATGAGRFAIVGEAMCLPIADARCDLVYFHLSLHYVDWGRALDEAWRVCRPGGTIWVWTFRPEHHRQSFLARWFPSVGGIDESRFPDPAEMGARLGAGGASVVVLSDAPERVVRTASDWRRAVEAGFVSTLQVVPGEEIETGLRRFDDAHPDPEGLLEYELLFCSVSAAKPGLG